MGSFHHRFSSYVRISRVRPTSGGISHWREAIRILHFVPLEEWMAYLWEWRSFLGQCRGGRLLDNRTMDSLDPS
jgi:hypothetical protein